MKCGRMRVGPAKRDYYVFSPPAIVIAHPGAMDSMKQVKAELRMPGFNDWVGKERFATSVEAAYKAAKGN
jgi:hypothetical protein